VSWRAEILDRRVEIELDPLAPDVRQRLLRIAELIEMLGLAAMHEPYVKHLDRKLWEMRKGQRRDRPSHLRDRQRGTRRGRSCLREKDAEDSAGGVGDGSNAGEGGDVMGIPLKKSAKRWMREPGFKAGYDALDEEFSLAALLIEARARANLTQAELAKRMGTSQSTIARLESGKAKPSLSTLRRLAKATGLRLKISLEPAPRPKKARRERAE
jgi:DNA-binding XRE family transcriptional regulator